MIIDAHNHYWGGEDFLKRLMGGMDEAGVEKVCLSGLGIDGMPGDEAVEKAFKEHPDRIIGFGVIFPGRDPFEKVDEFYSREFKGLKMIIPTKRYDHEDFMPYYQKAEDHGMPILFHTGVIMSFKDDRTLGTSSSYMRPAYLDKIARVFPKLKIIAAHMGDPWFLEAYRVAQYCPNMWLDISGAAIFIKALNIRKYLWIRVTPDKLIWGLDAPPERYLQLLITWKTLIREIGISEEDSEKIFGKTAAQILDIKH
jgi:predicted TIM-barrel fold metal-dependent hydrolase